MTMQMINPGYIVHRGQDKPRNIIIKIWEKRCLERNESVICAVVGSTGSGKTYTALSLACQLPHFKVEHIVFKLKDFIGLIVKGNLKKGSVILYDETEIDADNQQWYTKFSRYLSYIMATVRHRNYIIFFTMPYMTDILAKVRRLVHYTIECPGMKNYKKGYAYVRITQSNANHVTGEIYGKYTRVQMGRAINKIRFTKVYLPPKWVRDYYEEKKLAFTNKLYDQLNSELINEEVLPDKNLTPKQEAYYYMMLKYKPQTLKEAASVWENIVGDRPMALSEFSMLKKAIRKKGYSFEEKGEDYMGEMEKKFLTAKELLVKQHKDIVEDAPAQVTL